ncbi:MAG: methyltransferase domain-containing protein [Sediminibacterium sp.]|uniref:class I SAM-dependent methyltransferase n=1 Tax=Sediminibacterium sp. TaxID=1917865 RepID=UPI002719319B|nr:methyltransferase domain-containing protein [Sediminibacterium sp.]MDO8996481.1 methyltransferase domain-containing protein [Sediminibacterium sp.]
MHYPLVHHSFSSDLKLYIPDPLFIKLTYERLCLNDSSTLFPFWAKVWPSAIALSSFLQQNIGLVNNKSVLEIGAGIGLPSFSVAQYAADLVITDYAANAVELMHKNIEHTGFKNIKAIVADWNLFPSSIVAEVVLLSDTNYAPSEFASLFKLIQDFIHKGATIIIASPERITASPFIEQLDLYITQKELFDITYNGERASIGLFVLQQN